MEWASIPLHYVSFIYSIVGLHGIPVSLFFKTLRQREVIHPIDTFIFTFGFFSIRFITK